MKVDVLSALTGVGEAAWNSLVERSAAPSVFLTWAWQTEWARAFAPGLPLQILAVTGTDGVLAGLLPLYEDGGERLRVLGGVDVSDYLDLIAPVGTEEDVWQALLQHRAAHRVEWDLHAVRAASPTAEILPRLAPSWGLRVVTEVEERCPVLALPATWDEYLARLSGKDRHELKRKMRKLERELPAVTVGAHAAAEGWDEALGRFLTLHRLSKVGKARFMDERMERFFRDVTLSLARRGWARLWFLESEGVPVASFLCMEHGGTVGLYNSGFDPAHARLAPGIVLLAHVIQDAIERGVPVFDFLRGEESYKRDFGPTAEPLLNIRILPVKLRVAILSVHTCPLAAPGGKETGGMNVYVRETARELSRMGAHVDVFTRSQNPTIRPVVDMGQGARVIHLQAGPQAPMPREEVHAHLGEFVAGVEQFRREQGLEYDLIHAHYWLSGVAGLALREMWGAPLVQMFHTLGRLKNTVAQSAEEVEPELRIAEESRIIAEADRIVAANVVERAHLVWYYGARAERVEVIPCGVDTDLFQPMSRPAAKDLLELGPDPLLIYVGRLQPIKGLETLLDAMVRLPEATLLIIGGDQDEPDNGHGAELRRQVGSLGLERRVRFLGAQPQRRLRLFYAAADATVMPSYYESFGMVALEAMACGSPVVASRVGGLTTTIQDGVTGHLVPEGDPVALAECLARLLADDEARARLGREAARWAAEHRWPCVAEKICQLYSTLRPEALPHLGQGRCFT